MEEAEGLHDIDWLIFLWMTLIFTKPEINEPFDGTLMTNSRKH
jgi:hypothetical protein